MELDGKCIAFANLFPVQNPPSPLKGEPPSGMKEALNLTKVSLSID